MRHVNCNFIAKVTLTIYVLNVAVISNARNSDVILDVTSQQLFVDIMKSKSKIRSKYTIWLVNVFKAVLMSINKQLTTGSCHSFVKFRNCKPNPLSCKRVRLVQIVDKLVDEM